MYDVATIISILSMLLSIGNTIYIWCWQSLVHMRLAVRVRRVFTAAGTETDDRIIFWYIVNRSAFAVYIQELGFCDYYRNVRIPISSRLIRKSTSSEEAVEFPYKLASREGVNLVVSHNSQTEEMKKHARMYVKTCCGNLTSVLIPQSTF